MKIAIGDRLYYSRHPDWDTDLRVGMLAVVVDTARYRIRDSADVPYEPSRSGSRVLVDLHHHDGAPAGRHAVTVASLRGDYYTVHRRIHAAAAAARAALDAEQNRRRKITAARDAVITRAADAGYPAYRPENIPASDRYGYVAVRVDVIGRLIDAVAAYETGGGR